MEWIKVTDRLPEFDTEVLVFGEGKVEKANLKSYSTSSSGIDCCWVDKHDDVWWIVITHWMPLPEPPKDDA